MTATQQNHRPSTLFIILIMAGAAVCAMVLTLLSIVMAHGAWELPLRLIAAPAFVALYPLTGHWSGAAGIVSVILLAGVVFAGYALIIAHFSTRRRAMLGAAMVLTVHAACVGVTYIL